jgi:hypothetical protein
MDSRSQGRIRLAFGLDVRGTNTRFVGLISLFSEIRNEVQIGIAKWMSEHPTYHTNWTLQCYKSVPGHYQLTSKHDR